MVKTHPMLSSQGISLFLEGIFLGTDGNCALSTICGSSSSSISTRAFGRELGTSVGAKVDEEAVEESAVLGLRASMMALRRASFAASGSLTIFRFTLLHISFWLKRCVTTWNNLAHGSGLDDHGMGWLEVDASAPCPSSPHSRLNELTLEIVRPLALLLPLLLLPVALLRAVRREGIAACCS